MSTAPLMTSLTMPLTSPLLAPLLGALLTGLASSVHCFGMCGGLQVALSPHTSAAGLWRLQVGRTFAYLGVGALAGGLGRLALAPFAAHLRWVAAGLAALALVALAGRLLAGRDWLHLETLGTRLWRLLQPLGRFTGTWREPWRSLALGGLWAFIPCALVLSMAMLAAATGSAARGAALMGAFALGTWPALLGAASLGRRLNRGAATSAAVRVLVATGLLLLAAAPLMPWLLPGHHHATPGIDAPSMPTGHEHHHRPAP